MRVTAIAWRTVRWPIASHGAARGRTERAAVLLEVRTAAGAIGLGEAAPVPGMSRDTIEDAERAAAALGGRAPFDVADPAAAFALAAELVPARPAARFSIETALLDALAREHGCSLAALLQPPATAAVPIAAVVDDADDAQRAFAAGVRCFKIKLGPADDLDRVRAIAAASPGARLRIDANRSWPADELAPRLAALAPLPIDYVEEPCPDTARWLAGSLPCRLALDESLGELTRDELDAALAQPGLAALVLKPTLLGLGMALDLADRARRAAGPRAHMGVAVIVSHGLEGPIGTAACAELARALGGAHAVGLAPHSALDAWQLRVLQLAGAQICPAAAPGLGFIDLDLATAIAALPNAP